MAIYEHEFDVECKECRETLKAEFSASNVLLVEGCFKCWRKTFDEGKEEGLLEGKEG
ncbi:MAG: hypothetical protein ABIH23_04965 [bacterium]